MVGDDIVQHSDNKKLTWVYVDLIVVDLPNQGMEILVPSRSANLVIFGRESQSLRRHCKLFVFDCHDIASVSLGILDQALLFTMIGGMEAFPSSLP